VAWESDGDLWTAMFDAASATEPGTTGSVAYWARPEPHLIEYLAGIDDQAILV